MLLLRCKKKLRVCDSWMHGRLVEETTFPWQSSHPSSLTTAQNIHSYGYLPIKGTIYSGGKSKH